MCSLLMRMPNVYIVEGVTLSDCFLWFYVDEEDIAVGKEYMYFGCVVDENGGGDSKGNSKSFE